MQHPTPTNHSLPLKTSGFRSLAEALDYAAGGETGCNFYNGRGELTEALTYAELREQALELASRLHALGLERGARVALVADTHPHFHVFFFACQYAGLVPVPLPAAVHLGGREAFVAHLRAMLVDSQARVAFAPDSFAAFLAEASEGLELEVSGTLADFADLPRAERLPEPPAPEELAYLQYTSGSTRFPRGTMITQRAVLANLAGILQFGVQIRRGDRFTSWLPYYHDMGLVGLILGPLVSQLSVDYLGTRDFAMRPRVWLKLMSANRSTISFSPPFGYALCARRVRASDLDRFDLSSWRVAGVGAEMIRASWLKRFADALAPAGFSPAAFLPCYGMAECSLAVSFAPLGQGIDVDLLDADVLAQDRHARPASADLDDTRITEFVNCGRPLPDYEVEIRAADGSLVAERECGVIYLRGPSVMSGYANNEEASREALSHDGWLNTGDVGYRAGDSLFITGRAKDLLIINGRNIWPQDLEEVAEQQPEVRAEDASAFSIPGEDGTEVAVLVVQCRERDAFRQADLVERLKQRIQSEFGIACLIELVPLHTLPRTSSGKLSRSGARLDFLRRNGLESRPVLSQELVDRTPHTDAVETSRG
ncbi:fatty acyl-AMP ligase [Wenzhouxiangella marina]|uniref:AMP-dependent synthetase and ligase n=1 Tax=Wenzhouxiangella marina TaxID=1579979 RepID=A0A0K0XWL1_9GAMM|nr:fatty acyl-AMP ligase [Wenzhouxiangella marina]AKS42089.1 AMP-dependent synthetase and ligase [Wenzhouxiangella marina]MBB6086141.1 fatty-acyl-CoA synthase [Wenzhouxiangella marina]